MEVSARHDPSFPFLRRVAVSCRLITSHPWSGSRSKIDILTCNLFFSLFSFLGLLFGCLLISFSPPLLVAIEFLISLSKTSPLSALHLTITPELCFLITLLSRTSTSPLFALPFCLFPPRFYFLFLSPLRIATQSNPQNNNSPLRPRLYPSTFPSHLCSVVTSVPPPRLCRYCCVTSLFVFFLTLFFSSLLPTVSI